MWDTQEVEVPQYDNSWASSSLVVHTRGAFVRAHQVILPVLVSSSYSLFLSPGLIFCEI